MVPGQGRDVIRQALETIPRAPGVYKMLGPEGVIYVGKASNLVNRVESYLKTPADSTKTDVMVSQVIKVEFIVTDNEESALLLEAKLIRSLQPKYNILLKDDKSRPFLAIDDSLEYPRIYRARHADKKSNIAGPFSSAREAWNALTVVQMICKFRTCNNTTFKSRKRPCVEYQIQRCSAPCVGKISVENYARSVQQAVSILSGNTKVILRELNDIMMQHSENEEYERAAIVRDRIIALEKLSQQSEVDIEISGDYIGFYREDDHCCAQVFRIKDGYISNQVSYFLENAGGSSDGEIVNSVITRHFLLQHVPPMSHIVSNDNVEDGSLLVSAIAEKYGVKIKIIKANRADMRNFIDFIDNNSRAALQVKIQSREDTDAILKDMKQAFALPKPINIIEVIDSSHTSGDSPLSAIIVADRNGFVQSRYRLFNMDTIDPSDDYDMLRNALRRRFGANSQYLPDLLVIDGGLAHLNTAIETLRAMDIDVPCVSIAKGRQRRASKEKFYIPGQRGFSIRDNERLFRYMQQLRDEAHRFAISSHIRRRDKKSTRFMS